MKDYQRDFRGASQRVQEGPRSKIIMDGSQSTFAFYVASSMRVSVGGGEATSALREGVGGGGGGAVRFTIHAVRGGR